MGDLRTLKANPVRWALLARLHRSGLLPLRARYLILSGSLMFSPQYIIVWTVCCPTLPAATHSICSTTILINPSEAQPIEFSKDSELFTFQNCSDSALVVGPGVNLGTASAAGCLEANRTFVNQDTDRITSIADLTVSADSDFQAPLGASPALGSESHPQLLDFIADITHTPEPPLISTPPKRHT